MKLDIIVIFAMINLSRVHKAIFGVVVRLFVHKAGEETTYALTRGQLIIAAPDTFLSQRREFQNSKISGVVITTAYERLLFFLTVNNGESWRYEREREREK